MSNDTTHCVYRIVCFVTGDCYIGQTKDFNQRRRAHQSTLGRGVHGNERLQRAYNKYGKDVFYFEMLESNISPECIDEREIYWINITTQNRELYNMLPGGASNPGYLKGKVTVWNGVEYPSLNDAVKASGYGIVTMIRYIKFGYKRDADIPNRKLNKPMMWNGIQYRSINAAAHSIGVTWQTMQRYVKMGFSSSIESNGLGKKTCVWNNIQYESIHEAALANNVSIGCMSTRIKKGLKSDEDVKSHFTSPNYHPVTIDGISFPSMAAAARGTGKTYGAIVHMIKKQNQ